MSETCECGRAMENLGNINGIVYTSYPEQWDEVWVCMECKKKRVRRVYGKLPADYSWVNDFKD